MMTNEDQNSQSQTLKTTTFQDKKAEFALFITSTLYKVIRLCTVVAEIFLFTLEARVHASPKEEIVPEIMSESKHGFFLFTN